MTRGSMIAALAALLVTGAIGRVAHAQSACAIDVKQAQLYLDLGAAEKAVSTLEKCVEKEPGRADALAWLLLARAHRDVMQLDKAGNAVDRAKELGIETRLKEAPWASKFLQEFQDHFGSIQVIEAPCKMVSFNIALAGSVNAEMRKILESMPGWDDNRFRRAAADKFFLPAGKFRIGERDIEVVAGKSAKLAMGEIGAVCVIADRDSDEIPDDMDKCPDEAEDKNGVDDSDGCPDAGGIPLFWVVAGAIGAAAIGGTVLTFAVTKKSVYNYNFAGEE